MALVGRLHPLIVHFPIALVIVAAFAEVVTTATGDCRWRGVAFLNVRAGAIFALAALIAGWRLVSTLGLESSPLLEWHRWTGVIAVLLTVTVAVATWHAERKPLRHLWIYRIALVSAASLVAVTGHIGGMLVWGVNFLHP